MQFTDLSETTIGKAGLGVCFVYAVSLCHSLGHLCEGSGQPQGGKKGMDEGMWQAERREREMCVRGNFTCRWHQNFYKTAGKKTEKGCDLPCALEGHKAKPPAFCTAPLAVSLLHRG